MSVNHDSRGAAAHLSKADRPRRGRDTREGAQDDGSYSTTKDATLYNGPTRGVGKFLLDADPETPVNELGALYREWRGDA